MRVDDVLFLGRQLLGGRVHLALGLQCILVTAITVRFELEGSGLVAEYLVLEVAEADDDHGHVVEGTPQERVLQDVFDAHAAELVNILCLPLDILVVFVIMSSFPHAHHSVTIRHLIEDTITSQCYKVVVLFYLERFHIWVVDYHVGVATKLRDLGLRVSKCPRN